ENAINIVVDAKTQQEFNKQLQQFPNKSIYDLIFKRGMNITLHVPITYDSFELSNGWYYTYHVYGGHTGKRSGMASCTVISGVLSSGLFTSLAATLLSNVSFPVSKIKEPEVASIFERILVNNGIISVQ
ncbi:hypothetical protein ACUOFC_40885, partial [Escherichia sp. TWPC-MK]